MAYFPGMGKAIRLTQEEVEKLKTLALRSEERRVGKECRSLCDWSSDVCSSDLLRGCLHIVRDGLFSRDGQSNQADARGSGEAQDAGAEIGRASCRERV